MRRRDEGIGTKENGGRSLASRAARYAIFSFAGAALLGACATSDSAPDPRAKAREASRTLASQTAALGLPCAMDSPILRDDDDHTGALDVETWLGEQLAEGSVTAEWAEKFRALDPPGRVAALARALGESAVQARRLVGEFGVHVRRGYTLQTMIEKTDTYAELQALRRLKEDVLGLTLGEFRRFFAQEVARVELRPMIGMIVTPNSGPAVIVQIVDAFMGQARAALAAAAPSGDDARYASLALVELQDELLAFQTYASDCDPDSVAAERARRASFSAAVAAARSLRSGKTGNTAPDFSPKGDAVGIPVGAWIRERGRRLGAAWRAERAREPQNDWGDVFAPGTGTKGNIIGKNFPSGALALTFDDGPNERYTARVLDALKERRIPATFFVVSNQLVDHGSTLSARKIAAAKRARDEGHAMASHSYSHPRFVHGRPNLTREVDSALALMERTLGARPRFFRLPYGEGVNDSTVRRYLASRNLMHVYWSVDTNDWAILDPEELAKETIAQLKKITRGVVLFHDARRQTAEAIPAILDYVRGRTDLRPATIPHIVDAMNGKTPATPEIRDRPAPDPFENFGRERDAADPFRDFGR